MKNDDLYQEVFIISFNDWSEVEVSGKVTL